MRPIVLAALLLAAALPLVPQEGCDCRIHFRQGSGAIVADGTINTATEWNDADVLDSNVDAACLRALLDWTGAGNPAINNIPRQVRVWSKSDGTALMLAFEVHDGTRNSGGGDLPLGERIIVQFDPNGSRGPQLGSGSAALQDYRFEFAHKWGAGAGGQLNATEQRYFESTLTAPNSSCMVQDWEEKMPLPAGVQFALAAFGAGPTGGYNLELRIPLSVLGRANIANFNTATNIGVSFAIINDAGTAALDAFGVAFPASLPLSNAMSPLVSSDLAICSGWLAPNAWATGFFSAATPSVEISRLPVWWSSASVDVFPCNAELSAYHYDRTKACKLRVNARIENTGNAPAARNILFLWGMHGSGQSVWKFVDLQKNAPIPGGGGTVNSALWNDVPSGQPGHPCIRVYVLPTAFQPAFDEMAMRNITTPADLDKLENTYGVAGTGKCMAQKNLSDVDNSSCTTCPSNAGVAPLSPFSLWAQAPPEQGRIFLAEDEARRFGNNVIVQIETFGVAQKRGTRRTYNFIEPIGGAIEMFTLERVKQNPVFNVEMAIGNPGNVERRVFAKTTSQAPPGAPPYQVALNVDPAGIVLQPNEERVITASSEGNCFSRLTTSGTLVLVLGLVLLGLLVWWWRRP